MHSQLRSFWCMITETANVTTANNVVKRRMLRAPVHRRRVLHAGSADILVRNERDARKGRAGFARGADEDVRAPSMD